MLDGRKIPTLGFICVTVVKLVVAIGVSELGINVGGWIIDEVTTGGCVDCTVPPLLKAAEAILSPVYSCVAVCLYAGTKVAPVFINGVVDLGKLSFLTCLSGWLISFSRAD